MMERAIVTALADAGISARARPTRARTSPASGPASARSRRSACTSSRGVTTHGFAINVDNDLAAVRLGRALRPDGVQMTSVRAETARPTATAAAGGRRARSMAARFAQALERGPVAAA